MTIVKVIKSQTKLIVWLMLFLSVTIAQVKAQKYFLIITVLNRV